VMCDVSSSFPFNKFLNLLHRIIGNALDIPQLYL
jgi:hypothetical protein